MRRGIIRASAAMLCLAAVSVFPCTIFNAAKNGLVLAGNNEDLNSTDSRIWFYPPQAGKYGYIYVGFDSYGIQGGMNDRGVFFDFNALKFAKMNPSPEKPGIKSWRGFIDTIMTECATVEDVVALLGKYNLAWWGPYQVMFADATGASAVIGADRNGELSVIRKKGTYQVSTNFSLANPDFGAITYPCYRYEITNRMLEQMGELTVDYFRKILAAAHQEGANPTIYSNICDLTNKEIYLYNFHNFEEVAKLDLREEFKKGEHSYEILSLFPRKNYAQKAFEEAQAKRLSQVLLQTLLAGGPEAAVKKFDEVKADYSLVKSELDSLISSLRIRGRGGDMLEMSKLYVREFPGSADGHKRLGDLYQWMGKRDLAVQSYKKALELDPKNAEVIEILKKIEK
jgi:tetratricopeptide (TPR) repeat protein